MSSTALTVILEKIVSKDKDFRYMATSDLLTELQRETFRVSPDLERKLVSVSVNLLDDPSVDISNLAVSCLAHLVSKIAEGQSEDLVVQLTTKALGKGKQETENAGIALRALIKEVPPASPLAARLAGVVTGKLLTGAKEADTAEVALSLLADVVSLWGGLVGHEHERAKAVLLGHLDAGRLSLRKKALHCLAALCVFLPDDALAVVVGHLMKALQAPGLKMDFARSYVQAIGQISRCVGYRFGRHLGDAVPLVTSLCVKAAKEGDDDLLEQSLQTLEGFVLRCCDARASLGAILDVAVKYVRHDPNYTSDIEEDDDMQQDEEEENMSDEEYSDDEDMSWKVRRSAIKLVAAVIALYGDVTAVYKAAFSKLLACFAEREESVKVDVFAAMRDLLNAVGSAPQLEGDMDASDNPRALLAADSPLLVKATAQQLRQKSPKTKAGVFGVLKALVAAQPGAIAQDAAVVVPGVLAVLNDKSGSASGLKIEALAFLRAAMTATPPATFQPHLATLAPGLWLCVSERQAKVATEALRVCEATAKVLRPDASAPVAPPALAGLVDPLYKAVLGRLTAPDQDQEVKEAAILGMAAIVARLGDALAAEVPGVFRLLLERLRNEITRLAAVRSLSTLAGSPHSLDLDAATGEAVLSELATFLRKANRALRLATLAALEALASKYGPSLNPAAASACAESAASLVSDADLSLAALALKFNVTALHTAPAGSPLRRAMAESSLPPALELLRSPLLQGGALEALQAFFGALAVGGGGAPGTVPEELLAALLKAGGQQGSGGEPASRQALHNVARCVAVLCVAGGEAKVKETVCKLLDSLAAAGGSSGSQRLALLCLGEIGRAADMTSIPGVDAAVATALTKDSDEVKAAASMAMGGIVVGNLSHYLPPLLAQVQAAQSNPKHQYLLLQALNEVITTVATGKGQPAKGQQLTEADQSSVLSLLLGTSALAEGDEECRNVVAECLGRLALLPGLGSQVLDALAGRLNAPQANMRELVVSAVRHCVVERPHPVDSALAGHMLSFLSLMNDEDRHVRRAAIIALSAAAHAKPRLVADHLPTLLPVLYAQTVVREDLIRTVDLGPFKHRIDDGLELRKAAFECIDILLDSPLCRDKLDLAQLVVHLESGLGDTYDVKLLCQAMTLKLAAAAPPVALTALERLVGPLEKTLTTKLKSDAVKQEIDRHEDMLTSCLRVVQCLARLEGADKVMAFTSFFKRTVQVPGMIQRYEALDRMQ